jgi:hypothetical protein
MVIAGSLRSETDGGGRTCGKIGRFNEQITSNSVYICKVIKNTATEMLFMQ